MHIYRVTRTYDALVLAPDRACAVALADQIEQHEYAEDDADLLTLDASRGAARMEPDLLLYHAGPDDIRIDEAVQRYIDPDYPVAPAPPSGPPPGAWFDWRGQRWATDGYVLVREGAPMPAPNRYRRWPLLRADQIADARRWLDAADAASDPPSVEHLDRVGCECAPLLAVADARSAPWPDSEHLVLIAARREGRLCAVLSVLRLDP